MKPSDIGLLLALAALWGASYLFMRVGAGEFGPVALAGARAGGAALVLLPLLAVRDGLRELRTHWKAIAVVGIASAALPFTLFGFAALHISAGLSAIFNAVTPLAAAAIAALFLGERLGARRIAGCVVGFAGVSWLVWHASSLGVVAGGAASELAVLACLAGALLYAVSATCTKQRLANVSPLAIAAGGQLVSALLLALPAAWLWPATLPTARAGAALVALALACTALAYLMFFRLIANVGAARAVTVAFLIPAFGVLWGTLFLGETFTLDMAIGCALILIGTALAIGLMPASRRGRTGFRSSAPACAAHTPPARSHAST